MSKPRNKNVPKRHITPKQLVRIKELIATTCPGARLVEGVIGIVTCDGYAIEFASGVIHPLAFLDMMDGEENEPIDILKGV